MGGCGNRWQINFQRDENMKYTFKAFQDENSGII